MARLPRAESVFLNIPYDRDFETLYLAYIVGLTQLGLDINVTLAVANQGRLETIISLIEKSDFSVHDLSRIELSRGIPRFNMPLELGLALYRSRVSKGGHRVHVFERKAYRAQRSTSDLNGIDAQIHRGRPLDLMVALRNIFHRSDGLTTVPEMVESYRAVKKKIPAIRRKAGGGSLFEAAVFNDIVVAALIQAQAVKRARRS